MKNPIHLALIIAGVLGLAGTATLAPASAADWRSAWIDCDNEAELRETIACAKQLSFRALITHGYGVPLRRFSELTKAAGIESYWWFSPVAPSNDPGRYVQKLSPAKEKEYQALMADQKNWMATGYQEGGEPLPGHTDYCPGLTSCFHYPEVVAATKAEIKKTLEGNPQLTGIALDMFGYPNFRNCACAESERQLGRYRRQHPELSEAVARERFSRDTLVGFQNELCDYARQLRPGLKATVHVWPTYLPEPVYGNRLDLDYCCQTAAWFFQPYWSDARIAAHARHIVLDARRYHPRQTGVPFVGLSATGDSAKSAARFEHELRVILRSTSSRSLSVFIFKEIVKRAEYQAAVRRVWTEFGVKQTRE